MAGLLLHRSIRLQRPGADAWPLADAGASTRGVLLIALAGVWQWVDLPAGTREMMAAMWLFFVWTSTAAMLIAAATGRRGLTWHGTLTDRTVFALYVVGTIAVFRRGAANRGLRPGVVRGSPAGFDLNTTA